MRISDWSSDVCSSDLSIEIKKSHDGADYLLCSGAKFERPGQEAQTRTVMAFGRSAADVHKLLTTGKPVELAVQFNGGTIKVIGTPRERQAATSKRSEEHTSELQSLMRISYAVFCLKKKKTKPERYTQT